LVGWVRCPRGVAETRLDALTLDPIG
jgi:hypothetical protein